MRVERNLTDGTRLLVNHHLPESRDGATPPGAGVVVSIRTPTTPNTNPG